MAHQLQMVARAKLERKDSTNVHGGQWEALWERPQEEGT